MSIKNSTTSKTIKSTAAVGSALAVAFVPQYADASVFTVGGDGGTGSVTLSNGGDTTNLGGVLVNSLTLTSFASTFSSSFSFPSSPSQNFSIYSFFRSAAIFGVDSLRPAARSSVSTLGESGGGFFSFFRSTLYNPVGAYNNVLLGSSDNWVPGTFQVNGVNGGNPIFGWLQIELGSSPGNFDPTIISFTYDDEATDTTPFAKPIGGFSVDGTAIPEPTSLPALTLLALGAGGLRRHRKCTSESLKSA